METELKRLIRTALKKIGTEVDEDAVVIENCKEKSHGDYASTIALQLTRTLRRPPRDIAQDLLENLEADFIEKVEIAGPGFINFFVKKDSLSSVIEEILEQGEHYGDGKPRKEKINVEFVSANPTGNLHLGHARCAAIGDSICRIYRKAGYDITREYYVNDAGNQIDHLAESIKVRYHEILGDYSLTLPENGYHGKELIETAQKIVDEVQDRFLHDDASSEEYFKFRGTQLELEKLIRDLKDFRVGFDVFTSELAIRKAGKVEEVLEILKPYLYERDGAVFLKTTAIKDDKDRVVIKSDGAYTYLLPDIAYHRDKKQRGFDRLVDCLGADHHGYVDRLKASLAMMGYSPEDLDVELIQMVRLFKDGQEYKMSKRTGNAISLKELCDEVGVDAVRYFFVSRAASSHLDFDLDLAGKMESSNPVYYAQYAHARLCAVLEKGKNYERKVVESVLTGEKEANLMKVLSLFPKEVCLSAESRSPYKIANYVQKLATAVHEFYQDCRIVDESNLSLTSSRLALAKASEIVLKNALDLIGVSAPEKM